MSLRRALSLRVGLLVAGTVALAAAALALLGLEPMVGQVASSQFTAAAARVEATLAATFAPTEELLAMSAGWLAAESPSPQRPGDFNRLFQPVLEALPQVTSVVAGTPAGEGWLLLQLPDGRWHNRMTDAARWGGRHHLIDRLPEGGTTEEWRQIDYDVRRRPWFTGAMAAAADGAVHWTAPYTLFTTGEPGLTAARCLRLADGRQLVVGFDILLRDLSRATMGEHVGEHGYALVMADDGRLLAMPPAPAGTAEAAWLARLLEPAADLGLAPLADALAAWRAGGSRAAANLAYRSGGEPWLATVRPYALGTQRLWVVALAPRADFSPPWLPLAATLGLGLLLAALAAMAVAVAQARALARPLEALADGSRRIGGLDFSAAPAPATGIAEVDQLAAAQTAMAATLQQNQEALAARETDLRHQLAHLRATEAQLRDSEEKYRQLFDRANDGIFLTDAHGFVDCNPRGAAMFGVAREALLGRAPAEFAPERQPDGRLSSTVAGEKMRAAQAGEPQFFEWQPRRADGTVFNTEISLSRLDVGGVPHQLAIVRDVTERKRADEEIRQLAFYDPLTGLPNRRLFLDRLGHALLASERSGAHGALVILDLDNFKTLNDTQGHDAGDELLVQVAQRLQGQVRREDTVSRLGGDEFVVMLELLGPDETLAAGQAEGIAEKVRVALHQPYQLPGRAHEYRASASIGVALFHGRELSAEVLLKQADMALYKAKDAGRNAIRFYNPAMQAAIDAFVQLEAGLHRALDRGELVLHYQPQVAAADGRIVGVEALVRWRHPQHGLVAPDSFIPVAEHTGLILPLGDWVLDEACRQLAAWKAAGVAGLRMAVNLSARQLRAPDLIERVGRTLAAHGLAGGELELEVTESTAMQEPEGAVATLEGLRGLGVALAIDDFGTGYSSLSYLRRLPIQTLKLDRSFVGDIEGDGSDAAICAATIALAHNLELRVVAEGVETEAQRYFLGRVHHCDALQGYLFSRPLAAGELLPLLRQGRC